MNWLDKYKEWSEEYGADLFAPDERVAFQAGWEERTKELKEWAKQELARILMEKVSGDYYFCSAQESQHRKWMDKLGISSEEEQEELDELARKLVKWLNDNHHPHTELTITPVGYELKEGIVSSGEILDYVKD